MIKTIVFDLGNVILHYHPDRASNEFADHSPYTKEKIHHILFETLFAYKFNLGKETANKFFKRATARLKLDLTETEFWRIWSNVFAPNNYVLNLLQRLKSRYTLLLLANINEKNFNFVLREFPQIGLLDAYLLSYDLKQKKPSRRIYKTLIKQTGNAPNEIVFIDDHECHIRIASKMGIRGVHYIAGMDLAETLQGFGIVIN